MHGILWSYNVSNGSKSTYTGINAQNLNGLSEKVTGPVSPSVSVVKALNSSIVDLFCTHAAVTHSSWQFLMLSRASRMTMSQCWTNAKSSLLTWKEQIVAASCSMLNVLLPVTSPMQSQLQMTPDGTLATIAWRGSYITNPACSSFPSIPFCWERYCKSIAKVSYFHFLNIWMIG